MAKLKTHEEDCRRLLGRPHTAVHVWLDQFSSDYPPVKYGEFHRTYRHTDKVIHEEFTGYALKAAKIHLVRDYDHFLLKSQFIPSEDLIDAYYLIIKGYLNLSPTDLILKREEML